MSDGTGTVQHGGIAPDSERKAEGSCTICTLLKVFAVAVAVAFAAIVFPVFPAAVPRQTGVRTLAQQFESRRHPQPRAAASRLTPKHLSQ